MDTVSLNIVLFSHELEALKACGSQSGTGVAQLIDIESGTPEVVHLYPLLPPYDVQNRNGIPLVWHLDGHQSSRNEPRLIPPNATVWIDTKSTPVVAQCELYLNEAEFFTRPVDIIQTGAVSFTRNLPILETSVLSSSSVLCIGLGSGGSPVVDQLARAGVGNFILWDMDRLEAHNLGRHLCTLRDIGRRKVYAVRDHIIAVNPMAAVECIDKEVLQSLDSNKELESAIERSDCVIVGTDNNASRFAINEVAWQHRKISLYGRAFTRAVGGDVIQVIPTETPCYACHVATRVVEEEISSPRDADRIAYSDTVVPIEPGLIIDIHPIANMIARLALLRLCENSESSLKKVAEETRAPLYLWANRRENQFSNWLPMERSYDRLSILRWYAINVPKDKECMTCGYSLES